MTLVRNISKGPRGAYLKGVYVEVAPGKAAEADDYAEEWFAPVGDELESYSAVGELSLAELVALAVDECVIDDVEKFRSHLAQAIQAKRVDAIMSVPADDDDAFDHDGDGKSGGSEPHDPPSLSGRTKADLIEIATAEGAEIDDTMTVADIKAAIELGREDATKA